ncbi:hypothetical protein GWI34_07115 [Actinomadura sp. DSM 109109]|nr:hypothetical protein [Actinomadura lepetitiana]
MESLPRYSPMLAVLGESPTGDGWAAELKWDGARAVAYVRDGRLRLMSRNDRDITVAWPELAPLAAALDAPVVLDGEIVAYGPDGRPSFEALGPGMHLRRPDRIQALARSRPVSYMIFDFTEAVLDDLAERLAPLRQDGPPVPDVPPQHARDARWVRPELVGEVVFAEWTGDGLLRHPSWRGVRADKAPGEVRRE